MEILPTHQSTPPSPIFNGAMLILLQTTTIVIFKFQLPIITVDKRIAFLLVCSIALN